MDFSENDLLIENAPLSYDKETQTRKPLVLNAKNIMGTEEFTQFINEGHRTHFHLFQTIVFM